MNPIDKLRVQMSLVGENWLPVKRKQAEEKMLKVPKPISKGKFKTIPFKWAANEK